jgi:hypothetical protein
MATYRHDVNNVSNSVFVGRELQQAKEKKLPLQKGIRIKFDFKKKIPFEVEGRRRRTLGFPPAGIDWEVLA